MISLTRLNRTPLYVNPDLIQHMEATPDTVITLTSGNNFMVRETPEEIINRIVSYRRRISRVENLSGDRERCLGIADAEK
jgi:flagellar protein FlbD